MDKEDVVHIYSGILLSHRKEEVGSPVEMCVDSESFIQSDVCQKEKKIPFGNAYMWNLENGRDEHICRAGTEPETQRTDVWTWGEAGHELGDWV